MSEVPRRPGFTAGTEEEVWRGHPALRSTIYFWAISLVLAYFVSLMWDRLLRAIYDWNLFGPFSSSIYGPDGAPALAGVIPWVVCCMPVFWYSLGLATTTYRLTTQRLYVSSGILMRTYDQLELFRVRDFMVDAPIHLIILGTGHVRVISRDESLPLLTMIAQPNFKWLVDQIRDLVQRRKDEVGMREIETNHA